METTVSHDIIYRAIAKATILRLHVDRKDVGLDSAPHPPTRGGRGCTLGGL